MLLRELFDTELLAPNGKKSNLNKGQYYQVRSKEFKNWFGDWENNPEASSKLFDDNGEPMVLYHKTNDDIKAFKKSKIGGNDYGYAGRGFYFMPVPLQGYTYGKVTMPVFLSIKHPYIRTEENWNTSELDPYNWIPKNVEKYGDNTKASEAWTKLVQSKGFDGFIDKSDKNGEIVAFQPNQIKSAIGNIGTFGQSPNIHEGKL